MRQAWSGIAKETSISFKRSGQGSPSIKALSAETSTKAATTKAAWQKFREERDAALTQPHGWLSLTSFQWLPADFAPLELVPGWWREHDGLAELRFSAADALSPENVHSTQTTATTQALRSQTTASQTEKLATAPTETTVETTVSVELVEDESLFWFRHGSIVIELVRRGGAYAIRTRDSAAPLLRNFNGVPVFNYDPTLAVPARYRPFTQPDKRQIATANDKVPAVAEFCGEIELELPAALAGTPGSKSYRLLAQKHGQHGLLINFGDASNTVTTPEWRYLTLNLSEATGTADTAQSLVADFNYTLNWPSGLTPYGTCPRPVPENILPVAIDAGERSLNT